MVDYCENKDFWVVYYIYNVFFKSASQLNCFFLFLLHRCLRQKEVECFNLNSWQRIWKDCYSPFFIRIAKLYKPNFRRITFRTLPEHNYQLRRQNACRQEARLHRPRRCPRPSDPRHRWQNRPDDRVFRPCQRALFRRWAYP